MTLRPTRSVLYMPGSNARALEKAKTLAADAVILDLEDAVAPDAKSAAREQVCAVVKAGGFGHRQVVIRVNGPETPWGGDDMAAAAKAGADAILLPKPNTGADIDRASAAMRQAGASETTALWAMMETPLEILNAREIAAAAKHAGSRPTWLVLGPNELVKATRTELEATSGGVGSCSWTSRSRRGRWSEWRSAWCSAANTTRRARTCSPWA